MKQLADFNALVGKLAGGRKYRGSGIPRATLEDILRRELARHPKPDDALDSAKAILHNVMAPYLGDPDYAQAMRDLQALQGSDDELKSFCQAMLKCHDSTRERLPYLADFYAAIREAAPGAREVLDLACGLNPLALPWMGFGADVAYHAYDIHQPRVDLINAFLVKSGFKPLAEARDVLVDPPAQPADAAFLFKEAHRMEKRRPGSSRELAHALNARVLFISLPNRSLTGQRDLRARMDALFARISEGLPGASGSRAFPGETLYWIRNG